MENVIITGADGFVGSNTVDMFLNQGATVLALDIGNEPKRLKRNQKLTYMRCDVADTATMLQMIPAGLYDTFIHFAWAGSAGEARSDYRLQMQNALNTVECLKAAHQLGCARFVCAGSIMEYEVEAAIRAQGSRPSMAYLYGMGKHIAHCMCKSVAASIGIDLIWPMITNAYGVGELSPRFVKTTIRKIINCEPLQFTAATQNYDFVYITDVARAFYLIARNGKPFHEYMIGSSHARPLKEFILEMLRSLDPKAVPQFGDIPFTGTNLPLAAFDTSAAEKDCGFKAEVSYAEGTRMTMEWLKTV
jgi:nucleoside-diphosphate-sugar epimerase